MAENVSFSPNYTIKNSTVCEPQVELQYAPYICIIPAIAIVCFFAFLEKRRDAKACRCCGDQSVIPTPVNMLDGYENRLAFAAAFGTTSSQCIALLYRVFTIAEIPVWATTFYAMMVSVVIGIDNYPYFSCLSTLDTKHKLLGSFVGALYSLLWFSVQLGYFLECTDVTVAFQGEAILVHLPVLVSLAFLSCWFIFSFVLEARNRISKIFQEKKYKQQFNDVNETSGPTSDIENEVPYVGMESPVNGNTTQALNKTLILKPHQLEHVKALLEGKKSKKPTLKELDGQNAVKLLCMTYRKDCTFRYSPKLTATFTVALLGMYQIGVVVFILSMKMISYLDHHKPEIFGDLVNQQFSLFLNTSKVCWLVAFSCATLLTFIYVIQIFVSYRSNLLRLYQGDYSTLPVKTKRSAKEIMSDSMMYSGTQIAYTLVGYNVLNLSFYIVGLAVAYFIILPLQRKVSIYLLQPLLTLLPVKIIALIIGWLQRFVSKKALLQKHFVNNPEKQKQCQVLALNNRKLYHNLNYFLFFFYIFLGLYRCLERIWKGIVLGVFYMMRVDKSVLMHGFEHWDGGYMAYWSFLQMELSHCHPVLVAFCNILLEKHGRGTKNNSQYGIPTACADVPVTQTRQQKIRNRWLKAYTMVRNPSLLTHGCVLFDQQF